MSKFRIVKHNENYFTVERKVLWFFWLTEAEAIEDFYNGFRRSIEDIIFKTKDDAETYIREQYKEKEVKTKPTREIVGYY